MDFKTVFLCRKARAPLLEWAVSMAAYLHWRWFPLESEVLSFSWFLGDTFHTLELET